ARRLDAPTTRNVHERGAWFGYCAGIEAPRENRSLFILNEREMAFVYPLIGGRTLLSLYIEKSRAEEWRRSSDPMAEFLRYFDGLPDVQAVADAEPATTLLGYGDYPKLIRRPVWGSLPVVRDPRLAWHPTRGVSYGFALP